MKYSQNSFTNPKIHDTLSTLKITVPTLCTICTVSAGGSLEAGLRLIAKALSCCPPVLGSNLTFPSLPTVPGWIVTQDERFFSLGWPLRGARQRILYLKYHLKDHQKRRKDFDIAIPFRFLEAFESNVIYDMPEPRLLGPGDSQLMDQSSDRSAMYNFRLCFLKVPGSR